MILRLLLFSVLFFGITSCNSESTSKDETPIISYIETEIPEKDSFPYDTLSGIYSGEFGGSNIRIVINYCSQKNAVGYNIHLGLQRNISGGVKRNGDTVLVSLAEPGDHPYDGIFEISFIGKDTHPKGIWRSNSETISEKKFNLTKIIPQKGEEFDYTGKATIENFHYYFYGAYDTIGEYVFQQDGLAIFTYYPNGTPEIDFEDRGSARVEQSKTIFGNWFLEGEKVTLTWADNTIFPKQKMIYFLKYGEYDEVILDGENNPIHAQLMP